MHRRNPLPRRNPLHCLVPDYVLREIARRGGETEREAALDSLGVSATLRSARAQAQTSGARVKIAVEVGRATLIL